VSSQLELNKAFDSLVAAAKDYAHYMDQWDKFKFNTSFGMIYVSIVMETAYPNDYEDVSSL
jgi:hypothetical protein